MARVLVMLASYPADLSSGSDLRFQNLCKQVAARHKTFLVCLGDVPKGIDPRSHIGVEGFDSLPAIPRAGRRFLRHLRLTDTHFLKSGVPDYLARSQEALGELIEKWAIDVVICLVPPAAEMLERIHLPKLVDFCDSRTLTIRRFLDNRGCDMSPIKRLGIRVNYVRQRQRERSLVRGFDRTTTISEADRDCLLEVSGVGPNKVVVIPNGVAEEALAVKRHEREGRRSVVFWGNLDFPPNWTAVDYFNREIFLPYLAKHGIEWHIIGKGADESIRQLSQHPLVRLHGFIDDLYKEIASHGAMVNPMVEGSGLKNKVLEAFACRLPVVSTKMGIEAIGARDGEHYLVADDAAAFAEAILRCVEDHELAASMSAKARQFVEDHFKWNAIGDRFDQLVSEVLR
jgi:glycosyltransferase involved in cell wall biosynthesis